MHATATNLLRPAGRWPDDVMLWHVQIPLSPAAWNWLQVCLPDDEQKRALRYRHNDDRLRFAATRAILRILLARHTGSAPLSLCFSSGAFGRPELAGYGETLSFNVTHAGQHALIAISEQRCIGVDIEFIRRVIAWKALLETVCTDAEQRALSARDYISGAQGFLRCWTAKEAALKAIGVGIWCGVQRVSVDPFADGAQYIDPPAISAWNNISALHLHWVDDLSDYIGCIAFGPPGSVSTRLRKSTLC
ncbi:4'-phosphopantetheinyl transferase superfamily protein (plasmid) [Candidatus Vallotia cooleyia]|nr:4'-phosphopantetheinyl transferase superfamily protein [Candidatus Vallotia cooleyia]